MATPGGFDWDWNDVRLFLACVKFGSLRKAAHELGLNSSTVTRRIDTFEQLLQVRLLNRLHEGVTPTPAGQSILESAEQMQSAFYDVVRNTIPSSIPKRALVRLSITEGLGTFWVTPRLVDFSRQYPNILVDLRCAMESADVLRMEADVAVQFVRPTAPGLMVRKLGRLHVYPFAGPSYAERYGLPKNKADMINHRLIQQAGPQVDASAWAQLLGIPRIDENVGIRSNASTVVFYAIERGAGIGALPTFACALDAAVVPVDIGINLSFDIWLTYHPDARKTKEIATVIDWIRSIFDPQHYPWFRDEFIHPKDLIAKAPRDVGLHSVKGFFTAKPFDR
ncbi:MAG: LysR family transcriptional regulator [Xanthobacteraceae bacterium]